jgi:3-dehydroquinate dehydratase-2
VGRKPSTRTRALFTTDRPHRLGRRRIGRVPAPIVYCISGPNLQLLGVREPSIYGTTTLAEIHQMLEARGAELGVEVRCFQTNHEGAICDLLAEARTVAAGVLLNAAAYTHTSLAIFDALKAVGLPCVEVHLSNPEAREAYRHASVVAPACKAKVAGFGADSYLLALDGLARWLQKQAAPR